MGQSNQQDNSSKCFGQSASQLSLIAPTRAFPPRPFARRESFQASGRGAQSDASGDMQPQTGEPQKTGCSDNNDAIFICNVSLPPNRRHDWNDWNPILSPRLPDQFIMKDGLILWHANVCKCAIRGMV